MATAYVETTIPSYYVARTSDSLLQAAKQAATRKWWDEGFSGFNLFTSLETLDEASKGDSGMAAERLELLQGIPLLPLPNEGLELARPYSKSHSNGRILNFRGRGRGGETRQGRENGCRAPIALVRRPHNRSSRCF